MGPCPLVFQTAKYPLIWMKLLEVYKIALIQTLPDICTPHFTPLSKIGASVALPSLSVRESDFYLNQEIHSFELKKATLWCRMSA